MGHVCPLGALVMKRPDLLAWALFAAPFLIGVLLLGFSVVHAHPWHGRLP